MKETQNINQTSPNFVVSREGEVEENGCIFCRYCTETQRVVCTFIVTVVGVMAILAMIVYLIVQAVM